MAKSKKAAALLDWYHSNKSTLEGLASTSESILKNLIRKNGISVVSVTSRVKTSESLIEKAKRKRYKKPIEDITDFVGLRVITYTEDDASKVCAVASGAFAMDVEKSGDKSSNLNVDQIGYRSHHYICDLGEKRVSLPEFEAFRGLKFEIQIRTILQHAWAEVEHDRNYKFSGVLPSDLKRRMYLISGILEVGDRELSSLSRDIDNYRISIQEKAATGHLDVELDSTSVVALLPEISRIIGISNLETFYSSELQVEVTEECLNFGLKNTTELKNLLAPEFIKAIKKLSPKTTYAGIIRYAMIWENASHYFENAWNAHWEWYHKDMLDLISSKYGRTEILSILDRYGLTPLPKDLEEEDDSFNYE